MLFGEEVTIICGVQIKCRGDEAVDEVYWDEEITVPICQFCKEYLTQETESDTLDE